MMFPRWGQCIVLHSLPQQYWVGDRKGTQPVQKSVPLVCKDAVLKQVEVET